MKKYWISVVPKERVSAAVAQGIMQSQGIEAHLNRLNQHDWVIFYSPRADIAGTTKLQTFTAVGQMADSTIFPIKNSPVSKAFGRKVTYVQSKEIPLIPLIQKVAFIRNKKHWGSVFKMSLIQISQDDFELVTKAMEAEIG